MGKRLTLQQKREMFVEDVINKMFEIAGHSVTYIDIKDRKDDWYTQWNMTVEQNDEWKKWGELEIIKKLKYNKTIAEREMAMISLMWGLKFSNFNK
jgi:hypothetical protein